MAKYRPVSHVIFDMDGIILDTEPLYTQANQNVVGRYGKTLTWEIKLRMMGYHRAEAAQLVIAELGLPITCEEYVALVQEEYKIVLTHPDMIPAASKLVQHLYSHKIPMAVATSSSQDSFELKTTNYKDFFQLFDHIVSGGSDPDVKHGKPAPDVFLVTAERFSDKPDPKKCLVVEDSPNGVQAALNAGMQVIMVPDPKIPLEMRTGATLVVNTLDEVPLEKFGLPPMK